MSYLAPRQARLHSNADEMANAWKTRGPSAGMRNAILRRPDSPSFSASSVWDDTVHSCVIDAEMYGMMRAQRSRNATARRENWEARCRPSATWEVVTRPR